MYRSLLLRTSLRIILLGLALPGQGASPNSTRWSLDPQGGIRWDLTNKGDVPHADHMAMSGRWVDMILEWKIDTDKSFSAKRLIRWPMLRTLPDNTHSSLQRRLSGPESPVVFVNDQALSKGQVTTAEIHGTLKITTKHEEGMTQTRTIFTCVHSPAVIDLCRLINQSSVDQTVRIIPWKTLEKTDPKTGRLGSYLIAQTLIGQTQQVLAPGEGLTYALIHTARLEDAAPYYGDPESELAARQRFIETLEQTLVLKTPDAVLNRLFAFSKLRGTESIFSTRGGLMHGPGGYNKYLAAIWANDQAEYINPFFPFLGHEAGNESALNSFRHFARFVNPEYKPIPSSIISEGRDIWNGAGDRGDMAMIAYGASRFALASGNAQWSEELWPLITWCLEYCERKRTEDGVIASRTDELEGRFPAGKANLCTASLYYDALLSSADLGRALSKDPARLAQYRSQAQALRQAIKDYFEATVEGFATYRYYKENTVLRSWICVPLTMGIYDRKDGTIDALFSPRLWTADGLLTKAGTRTVWDRSTLYALRGILACDASPLAMDKLKAFSTRRLLGDHVPYVIEAYPEQNQSHLSAESGLYCRIFIEGLFGLRPTGLQQFTCTPQLPRDWPNMSLHDIKAFGHTWNLDVTRAGALINVRVSNTANQTLYEKTLAPGTCHEIDLAADKASQ